MMNTNKFKYFFLAFILSTPIWCFSQFDPPSQNPIWGSGSGLQNRVVSPLHNDPNWGVLPSQQILDEAINGNGFLRRREDSKKNIYTNARGEPILLDLQGNIVYNANGSPVVDSIALGFQGVSEINSNTIAPPPDDPIDVPFDGGVGVLLIIGLAIGYKTKKPVL